jgi:protein-S-isoprenylcysteine O-methyltransferase Ste14
MRPGITIAIIVFVIIAFAHLLRLIFLVPMSVGEWDVPRWISLLGVVLPLVVAWLLWLDSRNNRGR